MTTEIDLFRSEVPARLQIALLRAVFDGCEVAFTNAKSRGKDWFHDAVPALRRLEVEARLAGILVPDGFSISIKETPSTHYTQIESNRVVITAVTRSADVEWVAPYRYRESLARPATGFLSFAKDWTPAPADDAKLFALLVYGGHHGSKYPTLAKVVFPAATGWFVPGRLDLIQEHHEVAAKYQANNEFHEPQVTLLAKTEKKKEVE